MLAPYEGVTIRLAMGVRSAALKYNMVMGRLLDIHVVYTYATANMSRLMILVLCPQTVPL